jgi:hypothetical protein
MQDQDTPYGYCHCGCGEKTKLGRGRSGPRDYVFGHVWRGRKKGGVDYVVDENGCWIWQKNLRSGYGRAWRDSRMVTAHRWFWEQENGLVPEGLELDHLCRVRACVNPDHLEAVTREVNIRRSPVAKLTVEQVLEIRADQHSTIAELSERYGVTTQMIRLIQLNRNWKEVVESDA